MTIFISIFLFIIGAACGSFVGAMTWRMRYNELIDDEIEKKAEKSSGQRKVATKSSAKTAKTAATKKSTKLEKKEKLSWVNGRSQCEHCDHQLAWYDLLPIVSWLSLKGKCRYCKGKIGWTTLALEIGVGTAFAMSFLLWPGFNNLLLTFGDIKVSAWSVVSFMLWLVAVVLMAALLVYDARWRLLPNKLLWPLIWVALIQNIISFIVFATQGWPVAWQYLGDIALALIPVFGVYLILYLVSRGRWIGLGDVKFGVAVALILADWKAALLVLVLANLLGTLFVLPSLVMKKLKTDSQIAFGPFLIVATFLTFLFGQPVIGWATTNLFLL